MEPRRRPLFGYEPPSGSSGGRPLSVSEVNQKARVLIEAQFPSVVVRGEISNLSRPASGHCYFTLKDEKAQLAAAMFAGQASRVAFPLANGLAVLAQGRLSIYEARGGFQMIVSRLELAGHGDLEARLRALRAQFEAKGYFAAERKRALPFLPARIGIVTSPSGAAIHDMLRTIHRRFPPARVLIAPVRVQGIGSAQEIAEAIDRLNALALCDVLIVGRGGGSLEDLWAFNEAPVVEAIYRSQVPVISAVGHETDVTLSDLVADFRALTPTAAGERVLPELGALEDGLREARRRLDRHVVALFDQCRLKLDFAGRSWALRRPVELVRRERSRLDELERRLPRGLAACTERLGQRLAKAREARGFTTLPLRVAGAAERLERQVGAARSAVLRRLADRQRFLESLRARLEGLSPERVLARGFSITRDARTGAVLRDAAAAPPGTKLVTELGQGRLDSVVTGPSAPPTSTAQSPV